MNLNIYAHSEAKLQFFQNLLYEDAPNFFQFLIKTTETTLTDVLSKFRKEFTKVDLKK